MLIRRLAPVTLALAGLMLASPAVADCEPAGPIEEELATAPVVFVGRVISIDGAIATFAVREAWSGAVPEEVEVHGLLSQPARERKPSGPAGDGFDMRNGSDESEDDREWGVGLDYLVVPIVDGGLFRDSICTATTRWSEKLAEFRPAGLEPALTGPVAAGPLLPIVLAASGVLLLIGAGLFAFRRR
jgi:hypothetical protein